MSQFYFSHIDVNIYDQIISELRPYIKKFVIGFAGGYYKANHDELLDSCPAIKNWFDIKKLTIRSVGIIVTPANTIQDRHIDYIGQSNSPLALNFNIENCVVPRTKMYTCDIQPILSTAQSGVNYWSCDPAANYMQVAEFDLTTPVLFNTQLPHQVCNHTDETRISVSFRFNEDSDHLINNL